MKELFGEFFYLLLFALIVLGQYVYQWYIQTREEQKGGPQPPARNPAQHTERNSTRNPTPEELLALQFPASGAFAPQRVPTVIPHQDKRRAPLMSHDYDAKPKRFSRAKLFGSKRRIQDAVAASVILGPCRAYVPHQDQGH